MGAVLLLPRVAKPATVTIPSDTSDNSVSQTSHVADIDADLRVPCHPGGASGSLFSKSSFSFSERKDARTAFCAI